MYAAIVLLSTLMHDFNGRLKMVTPCILESWREPLEKC